MELIENKENYKIYAEKIKDIYFYYTLVRDKGYPIPMLKEIQVLSNNKLLFEIIGDLKNYSPNMTGAEYSSIWIKVGKETRNIIFNQINTIVEDTIVSDEEYLCINGRYTSKSNKNYEGILDNSKYYLLFWDKAAYFKNIEFPNCEKKSFFSRIRKNRTIN